MKNNKLGSGNRDTGSLDFFRGPDVEGKYNILQREKKDIPIDLLQEFRNNCKMAQAERWNVEAKTITISVASRDIFSRHLANSYPNAQRTASCVLDYFSGRRQITINLDPKNIPVNHRYKPDRLNLAFNDCEQLREKYVKKVSEKLANGGWENLPPEDREYYRGQYQALLVAMKFTNFYLKKLFLGKVSKKTLPAALFQEAEKYDNRMHLWYHRELNGDYSLNDQNKALSYNKMSQECATLLICREFEKTR